jgi:NAD(P) transhydrogenase
MLTALEVRVTIIDQRPTILDFADREIIDALCYHMRARETTFRLGEKVVSVERDERERVVAVLESSKRVHGDHLLFTVGRQPNTDRLNLEAAGVPVDARGKICVDDHFETAVPHIYAAGDVIGFLPRLLRNGTGRLAAATCSVLSARIALSRCYGFGTIPEISMVGKTEAQLRSKILQAGIARYEELAKGQILGDSTGLLKILFDPGTLRVLGVHVIGENAAEIIHIGQAVLSLGATVEYFRDTVFNYPTLAEAYKVAALDGLNKL